MKGLLLTIGKHTAVLWEEHIKVRLNEFGLLLSDVQSMTTDSGANIKKAGVDLESKNQISLAPCLLHSLHNSIKCALGLAENKEKAVCTVLIDDEALDDVDDRCVDADDDDA